MSYHDVDEESRTRTTAYFARQDCERYNSEHKHLYTKDQILSGEMLKRAAEIAYFRSRVFLNYREKFMTVKVEAPQIADKISDEDLQLLMPGVAPETFAARALQSGVRLVVLTRGAEGASAWTSQGQAHVERVSVEVVDTVGAGDTFQAALLTWLQESNTLAVEGMGNLGREDLEQALNFCARAAAITCTRRGADLPRRHELNG